jgi:hypothetical protein
VKVHNVGSRAVGTSQIRILDENLNVLSSRSISALAAPTEFAANSLEEVFCSLPAEAVWISVVPDVELAEITRRNNRVALLGTPFADPDGDLVPSEEDNCPTVANPRQADRNDRGAGNACVVYCDLNADDVIDWKDRWLGRRLVAGDIAVTDAHLDRGDVWPVTEGDGVYTAGDLLVLERYLAGPIADSGVGIRRLGCGR